MFKRAKDYYFIFSMLFMLSMGIYFVFQQVQDNRLNNYLDLLYSKISEMIEDEESQAAFEKHFADFIDGIKDGHVSDDEIKSIADSIVDIKLSKNKLNAEDIRKILPPVKKEKSTSLLSSFTKTIKIKTKSDWDSLSICFIKSIAESDSIFKLMIKNKRLHKLLKKQLDNHEKVTLKHKKNYMNARESFEKIQYKLAGSKAKILNKMDEEELRSQIRKLRSENNKIYGKLNSLEMIEDELENYRIKLQSELARLDTTQ